LELDPDLRENFAANSPLFCNNVDPFDTFAKNNDIILNTNQKCNYIKFHFFSGPPGKKLSFWETPDAK